MKQFLKEDKSAKSIIHYLSFWNTDHTVEVNQPILRMTIL